MARRAYTAYLLPANVIKTTVEADTDTEAAALAAAKLSMAGHWLVTLPPTDVYEVEERRSYVIAESPF